LSQVGKNGVVCISLLLELPKITVKFTYAISSKNQFVLLQIFQAQ